MTYIKAYAQHGNAEGASKPNTKSEKILNIPYKKLAEKKNTLKRFDINIDWDGIKKRKVVKTVVRVKYLPNFWPVL